MHGVTFWVLLKQASCDFAKDLFCRSQGVYCFPIFFFKEKKKMKKEKEKKGKETKDLHFSLKIYWIYENSSFFPPIKELIPWSQQGYGCEAILSKP